MIAPRWCEEQNGVYVPLIGKVLEADNLAAEAMCYQDIMKLAQEQGKQVATRTELFQLFLQKDEINEILADCPGQYGAAYRYFKASGEKVPLNVEVEDKN